MKPTKLAIIGCGAVAELQYAPAIEALDVVDVVALLDPSESRVAVLQKRFPNAKRVENLPEAAKAGAQAAIVASPANHHAEQAIAAMEAGMDVLSEKPMAATVEAAERMVEASTRTGKLLAVGHFRRFFPTTLALKELVDNKSLGHVVRYSIAEGGPFGWGAVSATFFQKAHSQGGVLHDHGAHVLDLVLHWFGEPVRLVYEDDEAGGLETNCKLQMWHKNGVEGVVRLSREWITANRNHFEFECGWVGWNTGNSNSMEVGLGGTSSVYKITLCEESHAWGRPVAGRPLNSYEQSFTAQLAGFLKAVQGGASLAVPGTEGIRCLRLIEQCYQRRKSMLSA